MERVLEIFPDGSVYEIEGEVAVKAIATKRQVKLLSKALRFTLAKTFSIAPPDKVPPQVMEIAARGGMTINQDGVNLIKSFEGMYLDAYLDPVGIPTIGYGHIKDVEMGMTITEAKAEEFLRQDLADAEAAVSSDIVQVSLDSNQFSALVSFTFNVGSQAFADSTLLRLLNQGDFQGGADQFPRWNKGEGNQELAGLTRRRKAERALFLGQDWKVFADFQEVTIRLLQLKQPPMQGDDVLGVQKALAALGFSIVADGVFGADMEKAVKEFQQKEGLAVDGIVGAGTRQKLGFL
ncbi:glycoside hydrolase family protein [Microcoleus sp. K5-D4]|uniref:glycoside hydrolase family protein n=1 Tax=Microcoleus sp. K5-D4 TaxID=2818801 RepID=UPI002FD348BB